MMSQNQVFQIKYNL